MKHEFLENLNNCNESTSFLYNENEFPSYPVPVGRRLNHLHQHTNVKKVNISIHILPSSTNDVVINFRIFNFCSVTFSVCLL